MGNKKAKKVTLKGGCGSCAKGIMYGGSWYSGIPRGDPSNAAQSGKTELNKIKDFWAGKTVTASPTTTKKGGSRKKKRGPKRRGTKRRGTKRRGTNRRGTNRRGTKRRGGGPF